MLPYYYTITHNKNVVDIDIVTINKCCQISIVLPYYYTITHKNVVGIAIIIVKYNQGFQ